MDPCFHAFLVIVVAMGEFFVPVNPSDAKWGLEGYLEERGGKLSSNIYHEDEEEAVTKLSQVLGITKPDVIVMDGDLSKILPRNAWAAINLDCYNATSELPRILQLYRHHRNLSIALLCSVEMVADILRNVAISRSLYWTHRWYLFSNSSSGHLEEITTDVLCDERWRIIHVHEAFNDGAENGSATTQIIIRHLIHVYHAKQRKPNSTFVYQELKPVGYFGRSPSFHRLELTKLLVHPNGCSGCGNMNGRELVCAANENYPWFGLNVRNDTANGEVVVKPSDGMDVRIVRVLAAEYNFSFSLHQPPDRAWGVRLPNGSFNGLTGAVAAGAADIAAGEITISASRRQVVDYTDPHFAEDVSFIMKNPIYAGMDPRHVALYPSFSKEVWLLLAATLICVVTTAYSWRLLESELGQLEHYSAIEGAHGSQIQRFRIEDGYLAWDKVVLLYLRCIVTYGPISIFGPSWTKRTLAVLVALGNLILVALFKGTITAQRSLPATAVSLNSIEDLAANKDYAVALSAAGTVLYDLFSKADEGSTLNILWKRIEANHEKVSGRAAGFKFVSSGPMRAYIDARYGLEFSVASSGTPDRFHVPRRGFYPNHYGLQVRQGSPLKDIFDRKITRLISAGIMSKWSDDFKRLEILRHAQDSTHGDKPVNMSLTKSNLIGAFYILLGGYIISTLVFVIEMLLRRREARDTSGNSDGLRPFSLPATPSTPETPSTESTSQILILDDTEGKALLESALYFDLPNYA